MVSDLAYVGGDTNGDGLLQVDEVWTYGGTYAVTQADIDAGTVHNTATADSDQSAPDDGTADVPLPQGPALTLAKSGVFDAGADGLADPGELVTYTLHGDATPAT